MPSSSIAGGCLFFSGKQAEDLCGFDPSVTRDDLEVVGDEDGIDEPKPLDRPRNLFQLLLGMRAALFGE